MRITTKETDAVAPVLLRWTIGDVNPHGFEALRLSVWAAWKLFGEGARYVVVVNTLTVAEASARAGALPASLAWRAATVRDVPDWLAAHLDQSFTEGTAWKLAPPQLDGGAAEIALDNDVILWGLPPSLAAFLRGRARSVIAADVCPALGQFQGLCGAKAAYNSGIRATLPGFDLSRAMQALLSETRLRLRSELDEQGLQVATLLRSGGAVVVPVEDVSICSPFPPHMPEPGRCGAHFVGLNSRRFGWFFAGRPAEEVRAEHWRSWRPYLYQRVGIAPDPRHVEPAPT